jgi:uncharacterized membrane protein YccC
LERHSCAVLNELHLFVRHETFLVAFAFRLSIFPDMMRALYVSPIMSSPTAAPTAHTEPLSEHETLPAPPKSTLSSPLSIRALFVWNDVKGRSAFAIRASLCILIPLLVGYLFNKEASGLIATIGAFTALYGEQLPYHQRAVLLAGTGMAVVLAMALGELGTVNPVFGVLTVSLFSGVAVWFYNSLSLGRPGAYLLVLVCAMGTMIQSRGVPVWQTLWLVAGGCIVAWCVQMSGYLVVPFGPQRRIVLAAARTVRTYVHALGTPGEDTARNLAAAALQDSWEMLTGLSPDNPFQRLNRRANLLFAIANRRESPSEMLRNVSNALVRDAERLSPRRHSRRKLKTDLLDEMNPHYVDEQLGVSRSRALNRLSDGIFGKYSDARRAALRITLGTALAGGIGMAIGIQQAYWAMAAAALVLHQSGGRKLLFQRGWFRLVGTLAGLLAAEVIVSAHPQGLWLIAIMVGLRYIAEMTVMRNYALSVIFITPSSLLVVTSLAQYELGELFFARGVDTLIGVAAAAFILLTVSTTAGQRRVPEMMAQVLDDSTALLNQLSTGDMYSPEIRTLQDRLRRHLIGLQTAYETALNESAKMEKRVTAYWANVVRIQRLGYDILTAGWSARQGYDLNFERMRETIKTERDRYRSMITSAYPRKQ